MRVPVSWLAEHLQLDEDTGTDAFANALVRVGMEVESVTDVGMTKGPVVVGRVAEIEELTGFKKPIRYCQVETGTTADGDVERAGIVCGATNFTEGDLVVVALPGAELPGGFAIAARKTYGTVSEGMICSARELGIGDEHAGILVLPSGLADPGTDAVELLALRDTVIELEITPDRGYCLSVRGLARELSCALGLPFGDPAAIEVPAADGEAWPVAVEDAWRCSRFVMRRVSGVDTTASTPWWMRRRLMLAGFRCISPAVDVTNYVMLETGQPLHAFDASALRGGLVVRAAGAGEKLTTLDGVERELDPDDTVICDDSGPISLAGVMGGATTEIGEDSSDILLEAAHWDPATIARTARRHKLPSEASRRFERFVDPCLPPAALELAARLLRQYGEGDVEPGRTDVGDVGEQASVSMAMSLPDRVAGVWYKRGVTATRLNNIGCHIQVDTAEDGTPIVRATPPSWRNDLTQPADLVEEVLRLEGYDTITPELPPTPPGRGLTEQQRRLRTVSRALAEAGYVEVLPFPFVARTVWDALALAADDPRRRAARVLNPLDADVDELATTLLPGMLDAVRRNVSRGNRDLSLFHIGQVTLPARDPEDRAALPEVAVGRRPSDADIAAMLAALPEQPTHVAAVLAGNRVLPGWWGKGEPAGWTDAVQAARTVAQACGVGGIGLEVRAAVTPPWHPGRCAELCVGGRVVGHAGELHPKVVETLELPRRTVAMELDLDAIPIEVHRPAPEVSAYPPVLLDVALVLDADVPAAAVESALREGGGDLLEAAWLFDVYVGEQLDEGKRSLAYSLRLRAPDRTLTVEEATAVRDAAVGAASQRLGATLRG